MPLGLKLDVTDQASIDATVAATVSQFGGLDILVNNAGIFDLAPIVEITRESYRRVYAVNVEGLLFMLQAVAKQMIKQGRGGKIINFASQAGRRGEPLVAIYCSSKAAVISLTQSAGLDLIKHRINVNGIAPGVVDNEHWDHVDAMFAKYENLKPGEKKRDRRRRRCRSGVWRVPTRLAALRHSSQAKTPTTSWRRPTISMAATG